MNVYSNYALVCSSNNELTVDKEDIYYVPANELCDEKNYCHSLINCIDFNNDEKLIAFPTKEIKYDRIYNKKSSAYEYDHKNLLCYNCIVNKNNSKVSDPTSMSDNKVIAKLRCYAALKQGLYKSNALKKSEGYSTRPIASQKLKAVRGELRTTGAGTTGTVNYTMGNTLIFSETKSLDGNLTYFDINLEGKNVTPMDVRIDKGTVVHTEYVYK